MKIVFNSPVILIFALVCTVLMVLDAQGMITMTEYFAVGNRVDYTDPAQVFTLFSHVLGHANYAHLMGNMTFILLLGPVVEEKYGSMPTLIMILLTALITGLLNVTFLNTGLLGASGIVFMFILLVSITNVRHGEIPITFILVALLYIGREVMDSFEKDQISQFGHIIGGILGSFFGFFFRKGGTAQNNRS